MSAESSNLSNIEHRAVIKYFVKKGKTPKKFLKTWYQFFRNLRLRIRWSKMGSLISTRTRGCEDDPRQGRPVTVVTEENVRKIEKLVLADRRIKLWQIAEELQISKERVGEIIAYEYEKNQCALGTKMLTKRLTRIFWRVHAMDEKGRPPKKFKGSKSASEAYGDNFWDSEGTKAVVQKRRGKLSRGVLFYKTMHLSTRRGFREDPEGHGLLEIDHHPTAQI
ncbi:Putative uncharacterized protein FLJ37770 [Eumeta japonica]|uniref:Mos1 transposase HTH domain-containing protein n=1 Tax=Eumeta variegata TaxID=151549 RepID=A0A4C1T187_EUMVA|nr:Putative uncharacterized protein FLJ37770 [Eumeta japonica]